MGDATRRLPTAALTLVVVTVIALVVWFGGQHSLGSGREAPSPQRVTTGPRTLAAAVAHHLDEELTYVSGRGRGQRTDDEVLLAGRMLLHPTAAPDAWALATYTMTTRDAQAPRRACALLGWRACHRQRIRDRVVVTGLSPTYSAMGRRFRGADSPSLQVYGSTWVLHVDVSGMRGLGRKRTFAALERLGRDPSLGWQMQRAWADAAADLAVWHRARG